MRRTVEAHRNRQAQRGLSALEEAVQGRTQLESQLGSYEVDYVAAQGAAGRLQIAAGTFRQVDHPMRAVNQDTGRRDLLDDLAVQRGLIPRRRRTDWPPEVPNFLPPAKGSEQPRQQPRLVARVCGRLINAGFAIDRAEQSRWVIGRF